MLLSCACGQSTAKSGAFSPLCVGALITHWLAALPALRRPTMAARQWLLTGTRVTSVAVPVQQCWVALQHVQVCHPEIRPEYSELLHMIGPNDPTLRCRHLPLASLLHATYGNVRPPAASAFGERLTWLKGLAPLPKTIPQEREACKEK